MLRSEADRRLSDGWSVEFDITALVEQSRLLVNGAPDTDGPHIVVSVVPADDVMDSPNEDGVGPRPDLADEFWGYTNGLDSLGLRDIVVPRSGADGQGTVELLIGVALKQCADLAPIDAGTVLQTDIGAFSVGYGAHPDEPERPDLMVLTPTS